MLVGSLAVSGCGVFGGSDADKKKTDVDVIPVGKVGPATDRPEVKAFTIEVFAPDSVRKLLQDHLELNRYRAITDLSDSEMTRLLVLAERDARNLVATQGYFSPTVRISKHGEMGRQPTIVVDVQLGPVTHIAKVDLDFRGNIETTLNKGAIEQRQRLRSGWKLKRGDVFRQDDWSAAKQAALKDLLAHRYPAAKIADSEAMIDAPAQSAGLGVKLDSGPLYRYGPMQVKGVERYDPVIVPRIARLNPGDEYDQKQIDDAQKRLAGSGYYDSAFIFVDPGSADPSAVPVQVTVREAPRKKVVFGVGFTTDGGPHASIEYTDQRVPGIGWRSVNKLQIEKRNPFAESAWTSIPDEDGWRWGALGRFEQLDDNELVTTAERVRFGKSRNGDQFDHNIYLQYDRASVRGSGTVTTSAADVGDGSALSANYIWTGRYFDSLPYPTRGYGLGAEIGGGYTTAQPYQPFLRLQGAGPRHHSAARHVRPHRTARRSRRDPGRQRRAHPGHLAVQDRRRHVGARLCVSQHRHRSRQRRRRARPLHGGDQHRMAASVLEKWRADRVREHVLRRCRRCGQQAERPAPQIRRRHRRAGAYADRSVDRRRRLRAGQPQFPTAPERRFHVLSA